MLETVRHNFEKKLTLRDKTKTMDKQEEKKKSLQEKYDELQKKITKDESSFEVLIEKQRLINSYNEQEKKEPFQLCLDNSTDSINF